MEKINDLCKKFCEKIEYQATTIDGSRIEFESFEELIEYENYEDSKIKTLEIDGSNSYQSDMHNRIAIYLGHRLDEDDISSSFTFDNPDDETVFKKMFLEILKKCGDDGNTLFIGRILFVFLCLVIDFKIALETLSGASLSVIFLFSAILLFGTYLMYKFFDSLWKRLFPTIVFALGDEKRKEDQRNQLKTNIIWGIIITSILSVFLSFIT